MVSTAAATTGTGDFQGRNVQYRLYEGLRISWQRERCDIAWGRNTCCKLAEDFCSVFRRTTHSTWVAALHNVTQLHC